jgi:hypothetical protein
MNCFAAGTPILGEHGARPIEEYKVGDKVWARDENDPRAPLVLRDIEECFVSDSPVWHLHVRGHGEPTGVSPRVIRTTDEHPFWVEDNGWTAARDLEPGNRILGRDGESAIVEEVYATGVWETVYNFRVADYHTYFVGEEIWGFDLWAHNTCAPGSHYSLRRNPVAGSQANHLNQNAVYGTGANPTNGISYGRGMCIWLQGSTQQPGSQHYRFHESLNAFWRRYLPGGDRYGLTPTNRQYGAAVRRALRSAGVSDADARVACLAARQQRIACGFDDNAFVPHVPGL